MNQNTYTAPTPDLRKGSLYMIVGFFFMAAFGAFLKASSLNGADSLFINFLAYLTGSVFLLPYSLSKGLSFLQTEHFSMHFKRAVFGCAASFLYILSVQYIPLVNATLLFNTTPLFIPILSIFMLHSKVTFRNWMAILLGFVGIIIIIKPTVAIFENPKDLIGLSSGISLAVAFIYVKELTKTEPPLRILCYFFSLAALLQAPFAYWFTRIPSVEACVLAVISGSMLTLAQLCIVKAYQYAKASKVGIFQYSFVVFIGIIDWIVWNVTPPLIDILGILLVIIAGVIVIRSQSE